MLSPDSDSKADGERSERKPTRGLFYRVTLVLIWAVSLIALVYGIENWRGQRAW